MNVVIVDYGSGNLRSAAKAFERAAREGDSGAQIVVSDAAETVAGADRVVLPGVGAFADCMAGIEARPGLREALEEVAITRGRPFLGICVGMQLMATRGLEHGSHPGFGWIAGEVARIEPAAHDDGRARKVPHMGWNEIAAHRAGHPLLAGIGGGAHMYFVHSYHMVCEDAGDLLASADYGGPVCAMVARGNCAGVQFHPEKSQAAGLRLIANFLDWRP